MKNIKDCMKSRMKKRAEFVKAPYGYRIKDRQLVVEEMEAFRVRVCFKVCYGLSEQSAGIHGIGVHRL